MRYFGPSQTAFSCNFYKTKQHAQRVHPPCLLKKSWDGITSWTWCCYSHFRFTLIYFTCILVPSHAVTSTPACQNGGFCSSSSSSPSCVCPSGYSGSYCQYRGMHMYTTRDLHASSGTMNYSLLLILLWSAVNCTPACQNGGTCRGNSSYAYCDCLSGYSGAYCQDRGRHKAQCQPPCRL